MNTKTNLALNAVNKPVSSSGASMPKKQVKTVKKAADSQLRRRLDQFVPGIVVVIIWALVIKWDDSLTYYFSSPQAVAGFLAESVSSSQFWGHFWSTMQATLLSFGLGSVAGIACGIIVSLMPRLENAIEPYAPALNSLPRIALAPIFIAFLGLGLAGKVAVGVSLVFFVLFYNCRAGVKSVEQDHLMLASALKFNKSQMFWKLLLPVAWPSIFAGLRLGFTYALLGVVSSEIVASRAGLGQLIMLYSAQFRMDAVYGTLIWMGVVSGGVYWVTGLIEKRLLRWKTPN